MIQPEDVVEAEGAEWYRPTPVERWLESESWRSCVRPKLKSEGEEKFHAT